ncbi:E3 ubiquitin-protein ligase COP1-like isoform X2 [Salvia splendens]|uniref:E3 ubiquitin-protein ligase COP1-like isoform X2 n=1 Tax=Salvia splendens TaxID=180675 RepID=UPI001C25EFF9|nr:E3 ubiquitin-protein ligase COP1-like isoform X2 [Salvia splendens]
MGAQTTSIGGPLVPTVKSEPVDSSAGAPAPSPSPPHSEMEHDSDKDILCPICMQIIKDAFLTACGHSFCYMCIVTHLQNKSDCPCCSHFLTANHLYPNFLLNKLLMKTSARQTAKTATPLEQLRQALERASYLLKELFLIAMCFYSMGCEASVKDLESLMSLLSEKKSKMEQEEAETNLQILLDFMLCLRKKKLDELNEVQSDLKYIKEDIHAVERRRIELYRRRDRYSAKLRMLGDDPFSKSAWPSVVEKHGGATASRPSLTPGQSRLTSGDLHNKKADVRSSASHLVLGKDSYGGSDIQNPSQSGQALARKKRVHAQFNDLQDCYLQKRRYWAKQMPEQQGRDSLSSKREVYSVGLEDFQSVLSTFTRYSRLRVVAELRHGDLFHAANIVSSIEFDRDDELFATAGVSRQIKIFEFSSVVNEPADSQCPVAEMSTRAKLSCLSWNKYAKNHIASSDYEGIVTVWDVTTRQSVMEYEEHEKRAWSVDFSCTDPSMLVSGSDDCKVKVWCTNQEASVLNIDMKANICSVKYNPGSSIHVAVGSADHHIHYYDLRKVSQPLYIFSGHRKAVSYVKFLSSDELASASTDSTLRLWDVKENVPLRTFRGHANEKNFVGLTANSEYIACGSETNEAFVYHKAISKPAAWHKFNNSETEEGEEDAGSYFISAVCWKSDSPTMVTANSQGTIKVLVLAP